MKAVLVFIIAMVCLPALAEEKTCALKGMDCQGCVDTVKEKVCNDSYAVCDVKIKNPAKKMGELHVSTKDPAAKIDEQAIGKIVSDITYTLEKCSAVTPKTKG
jgi:hypothetical protein